jgi:hypothetical protein
MSEEKRKFLRFECLLPAEVVRVESERGLLSEAKVDEISREGLKLVLNFDFNIHPGATIDFRLDLPGKKGSAPVSGEVMWSKCLGNKWEVGLRIKDMHSLVKGELLDWAYNKWREQKQGNSKE